MKLLTVFLFLGLMQVSARSSGQNVSISGKNISLEKVFKEIKKQSGYVFFYDVDLLNKANPVTIDVTNQPVETVLELAFHNQPFTWSVQNKTVTVVSKPKAVSFFDSFKEDADIPATIEVQGVVTDENGKPLEGVSVVVKGTNKGTSTNGAGRYSISVDNENAVLVFSMVGYGEEEIEVKRRTTINVKLTQVTTYMDEMIVVGYGSQKVSDITGSIAVIGEDDIDKRSVGLVSFDRTLAGLAKGVLVNENDGVPGAGTAINIRGYTSPFSGGNNQPLFVLDGLIINTDAQLNTGGETDFTVSSNPLLVIDPSNIEKITVLKDAAATAIYGSRGANGVIIVTTKKGKLNEKAVVGLTYTETIGKPIAQLKPMNTQQFKEFTDLLLKNTVKSINNGEQPTSRLSYYIGSQLTALAYNSQTRQYTYNGLKDGFFGNSNIDWFNKVFRENAHTRKANINIRGGAERLTYSIDGVYNEQQGIMINSNLRQYNFSLDLNTDLNKYIKTGASVNLNSNQQKLGNTPYTEIKSDLYLHARPDIPPYAENGNLVKFPTYDYGAGTLLPNPIASMQFQREMMAHNFIGNGFITVEPIKRLKIKSTINVGSFLTKTSIYTPQVTMRVNPTSPARPSSLDVSEALQTNYIADLTAEYDLFSLQNQRLNFVVGFSWDRTNIKRESNYYTDFPDDEELNNVNNATNSLTWGGGQIESGLNSVFTRVSYSYKEKYLATFNFRSDASSKFGPGNKRGYFPAISFGWVIDKEPFFPNKSLIDLLKLRLSAGKTGLSNIQDFAYFQFFQKGSQQFSVYHRNSAVEYLSTLPNPDISWESTYDYNIGLDFGFKNEWLSGSIDAYYRNTPNGIASTPFSVELGPTDYISNLIDVTNQGIEIELNSKILEKTNGIKWSTGINWAFNRNKIKSLNNAVIQSRYQDYYIQGKPLGTIKGYKTEGIYQSQAEVDALNILASEKYGVGNFYDLRGTAVGDYKLVDINGDGRINSDDRVPLGNIEPTFFGGVRSILSYKGFDFSVFFQFIVGNKATWGNWFPGLTPLQNNLARFADNTWTEQNKNAKYPRAVYGDPGQNSRINDQSIYDASFLRLKTLTLNYSFNSDFLQKFSLKNLSLFVSGNNLFTFTKWPGIDPGAVYSGAVTGRASNNDPYPLSKSMSIGIHVQF